MSSSRIVTRWASKKRRKSDGIPDSPSTDKSSNGNIDSLANELLANGGFLRGDDGGDQRRRLLDLCNAGDWNVVRYYVEANERTVRESLSMPLDVAGNTPLHLAVSMADHSLVCLLLLKGADPNVSNRVDVTPTTLACRLGIPRILKTLRKHGGVATVMERKMAQSRAKNVIALAAGPAETSNQKTGNAAGIPGRRTSAGRTGPPSAASNSSTPIKPKPNPNPAQSSPRTQGDVEYNNEVRALVRSFPRNYFTAENAAYLGATIPTFDAPALQVINYKDANGWTPLMKAAYKGHRDLVKGLITRGASVREFDNIGCTALVWACLGGDEDCIDILLEEGAPVNAFLESAKFKPCPPPTPLIAAAYVGNVAVVRRLVEAGARTDTRIGPGRGKTALMVAAWMKNVNVVSYLLSQNPTVDTKAEEWVSRGIAVLKRVTDRGILFATTQGGLKSVPKLPALTQDETDVAKKVAELIEERRAISSQQAKLIPSSKFGSIKRKRAKADPQLEAKVLADLLDRLPDRGTELDFQCFVILQCAVELLVAASRNQKAEYVTITAKMNHLASEIAREVDSFDHVGPALNLPRMSTPVKSVSPTTTTRSVYGEISAISFSTSAVRAKLRVLSSALNGDLPRALLVATKIACGVWPPAEANQDMSVAAGNIARVCRELVDLANATGYWPIVDKELVLRISTDHVAQADNTEGAASVGSGVPLTYDQYKRVNDLRELEETSKQYDQATQEIPAENVTERPGEKFLHDVEFVLLRQFVAALSELKKLHEQHLKEEYLAATSLINARADTIVEEIRNFDMICDLKDSIMIEPEDMPRLQATGISTLLGITALPTPIRPFIVQLLNDVKSTSKTVTMRGSLAAGIWPTPTASQEMLAATIPCVLAVKALVNLTKEAISKSIQQMDEERRKKEEWNRTWQQNERTKKMFKILDSSEAGAQGETDQLTKEETVLLEENTEGLLIEGNLVKGGRLPKLIEQITQAHRKNDPEITATLLMTHHSFTSSIELFDAFIKRYDIAPPYGLNKQNFEFYINKKIVPIRWRVSSVIRLWIEQHPEDFIENEVLVRRVTNWIEKKLKTDFDSFALSLSRALNTKLTAPRDAKESGPSSPVQHGSGHLSYSGPKPILPRNIPGTDLGLALLTDSKFFFDIDPLEIARQLALTTFTDFKNVRPVECLDQIWGEKRRKELNKLRRPGTVIPVTPQGTVGGIGKLIQHTNRLSMWVAHHVLNCDSMKSRASALKYFCQLALHCRELNDFNGITGIVAGLSMAPVLRLKKAWQSFEDKYPKILEAYTEVADLVSPKGQYANYRKVLAVLIPPAIPFLGVYLTDLTFVELGNPDYLPESSFINFEKRRKAFQVIKDIQKFQVTPFEFAPVLGIQRWLDAVGAEGDVSGVGKLSNDDQLYEASLAVEPREDSDDEDDEDEL
ncbi:hypothetical protein SmJEL517_g04743 [Synchytrium microbalum]|uniref:Ras-GEF domain-containing protein n=1 Tax=Synchytrium microbalum TaxID=1806994 RepID=A0A507BY60_9FUNG|nr:uncharacterized protein SmJEL517_g04743 [Synchytrium microbalum]TPX32051.1 hypothetical protein SmJEL517_g04743 [Synchytrium microbalum]